MTQLTEYQDRISRALDRLSQGVDRVGGASSDALTDLQEQLAQAQAATAEARAAHDAAEEARSALEAETEGRIQEAVAQAENEKTAAVRAAAAANAALDELREQQAATPPEAAAESFSEDPGIGSDAESATDAPQDAQAEAEIKSLREALDDEKMANAQLEERYRVLQAQLKEGSAAPTSDGAGDLADLDQELRRLRNAVSDLEESNRALREANAQGVGDPELINASLQSELESLRAARASERAEGQAVLAALEPLLQSDETVEEGAG
ncbi:MAG: hypothetical protein N4A61_15495 [Pelagimonas sp.]|jgi:chromosome segregation ATPase|nr:hypothetical protein [Pelagimonas sp.]